MILHSIENVIFNLARNERCAYLAAGGNVRHLRTLHPDDAN